MKKKVIIVAVVIMAILIFKIVDIYFYFYGISCYYKNIWNVNIPDPKKADLILKDEGIGDYSLFEIRYYEKEDIDYITNMKETKEIKYEKDKIYNEYVKNYIYFLHDDEKKIFNNNFKWSEMEKKIDHYILLKEIRTYDLMLINSKDNIVYDISCSYCYD